MIISYQDEIKYWIMMSEAAKNRDFKGVTYLYNELFEALQEKLINSNDKKERARLLNDLTQTLIFGECQLAVKCYEAEREKEEKREEFGEGDEWKQNG